MTQEGDGGVSSQSGTSPASAPAPGTGRETSGYALWPCDQDPHRPPRPATPGASHGKRWEGGQPGRGQTKALKPLKPLKPRPALGDRPSEAAARTPRARPPPLKKEKGSVESGRARSEASQADHLNLRTEGRG